MSFISGVQTWNAHWTTEDLLNPSATDIWVGKYVGHGRGELEGWQSRTPAWQRAYATGPARQPITLTPDSLA